MPNTRDIFRFEIHFDMGGKGEARGKAWAEDDLESWIVDEGYQCGPKPGYQWIIEYDENDCPTPRLRKMTEDEERQLIRRMKKSQPSTLEWFGIGPEM